LLPSFVQLRLKMMTLNRYYDLGPPFRRSAIPEVRHSGVLLL